ncbi:hypothetical protein [Paenibacillus thiaminolyticus]|uniref:hypothetical protein n=1 Tax=Paenibacillus thiaminolyticus TaxID=49283 RepID=UPI00254303AA|nr:hypothetical protein [Paenibacillus thiaminolyticus]WII36840.1 hypothetical protein O0V01_24930 [Paenibacillus thiaminolyticus]
MDAKEMKTAIEEVFRSYRFHSFLNRIDVTEIPEEARLCKAIDDVVSNLDPDEQLLIRERYMKQERITDTQVYSSVFDPPISAVTYGKIRYRAFQKLLYAFSNMGLLAGEGISCRNSLKTSTTKRQQSYSGASAGSPPAS